MPDRRTARKVTLAAQAAGLALLLTATGVAALGLPGVAPRRTEAPEPPPPPPADDPSQAAAPTGPRIDSEAVSFMLGSVRNRPTPPAPVVDSETDSLPDEPVRHAENGPVRYLGAIVEPNRSFALLSIDGVQRMVAVGREYGGYRVVRVEPEHVVLSSGADDIVIDKHERQGPSVGVVTPQPRTAGMAGASAAQPITPQGMDDPAAMRARATERAREVIERRMRDGERGRIERGEFTEDQR